MMMRDDVMTMEAQVLHAALDKNDGEIAARLETFLEGELIGLFNACLRVQRAIRAEQRRR